MFLIIGFATISYSKENKAVEKIDNVNKSGYKGCYIEASGKTSEEEIDIDFGVSYL